MKVPITRYLSSQLYWTEGLDIFEEDYFLFVFFLSKIHSSLPTIRRILSTKRILEQWPSCQTNEQDNTISMIQDNIREKLFQREKKNLYDKRLEKSNYSNNKTSSLKILQGERKYVGCLRIRIRITIIYSLHFRIGLKLYILFNRQQFSVYPNIRCYVGCPATYGFDILHDINCNFQIIF